MKLQIFGSSQNGWSGHGEYEPGVDTKLAPCPFCGGTNIEVSNTHTPFYWVECCDCGAEGPRPGAVRPWRKRMSKDNVAQLHRDALQASIDLWNSRATK